MHKWTTKDNSIKGAGKMFKVNEIVMYGLNGVCKVVEVEEKNLLGTKKEYLVLKPVNGDNSTYFVPIDNDSLLEKLHTVLTEKEIAQIIASVSDESEIWIDDEKKRKEYYKKIITIGNHADLIRMIKSIHLKKREREEMGKQLHISDERFLKDAKKILYDEFQYVLKLSEQELAAYIFHEKE